MNTLLDQPIGFLERGWRDGSMVNGALLLLQREDSGLFSACTSGVSQLPLTPAPEDVMSSSSLWGHSTHMHRSTLIHDVKQ